MVVLGARALMGIELSRSYRVDVQTCTSVCFRLKETVGSLHILLA